MTCSALFDGLPEEDASAAHCFGQTLLERSGEVHGDDAITRAVATAGAAFYLLHDDRLLTRPGGRSGRELLFSPAEAALLGADHADSVVLGHGADGPRLAALVPDPGPLRGDLSAVDLRGLALEGSVAASDLGAVAKARSLTAWNARHVHCMRCGGPMIGSAGGYRRTCARCNTQEFPRTDPVVIMLVVDGARCLLGRQRHFPSGRYSCLAGFVEPGEAIEAAVRREVREEAGILVGRVRYHSSQPWPFPYSLMIACHAEARSTRIARDESELEDCRWFGRAEAAAMLAGRHTQGLTVPPVIGIANSLIRVWVEHR